MNVLFSRECHSIEDSTDTLTEARERWDKNNVTNGCDVISIAVNAPTDLTNEDGSGVQDHIFMLPRGQFEKLAERVRRFVDEIEIEGGDPNAMKAEFPRVPTERQNIIAELVFYMLDRSDEQLREDLRVERDCRQHDELWYGYPRVVIQEVR